MATAILTDKDIEQLSSPKILTDSDMEKLSSPKNAPVLSDEDIQKFDNQPKPKKSFSAADALDNLETGIDVAAKQVGKYSPPGAVTQLVTGKPFYPPDVEKTIAEHPVYGGIGKLLGGLSTAAPLAATGIGLPAAFAVAGTLAENQNLADRTQDPNFQPNPAQLAAKLALSGGAGAVMGRIFDTPATGSILPSLMPKGAIPSTVVSRAAEQAIGAGATGFTGDIASQAVEGKQPDIKQALINAGMNTAIYGLTTAAVKFPELRDAVTTEGSRLAGKPLAFDEAKGIVEKAGINPENLSPEFVSAAYNAKKADFVANRLKPMLSEFMAGEGKDLSPAQKTQVEEMAKAMTFTKDTGARQQALAKWLSGLSPEQYAKVEPFYNQIKAGADPVHVMMMADLQSKISIPKISQTVYSGIQTPEAARIEQLAAEAKAKAEGTQTQPGVSIEQPNTGQAPLNIPAVAPIQPTSKPVPIQPSATGHEPNLEQSAEELNRQIAEAKGQGKSMMIDFPAKSPLHEEAKKYKTAGQFIDSQVSKEYDGTPLDKIEYVDSINPKEGILTAAISANGKVYTGRTHAIAIEKAVAAGDAIWNESAYKYTSPDGQRLVGDSLFITDSGKLVDRTTASEGRSLFASGEFTSANEKTFTPADGKKSQLTSIWNEANKQAVESPVAATTPQVNPIVEAVKPLGLSKTGFVKYAAKKNLNLQGKTPEQFYDEDIKPPRSTPSNQPAWTNEDKQRMSEIQDMSSGWEAGGTLIKGNQENQRKIRAASTFPTELSEIGLTHRHLKTVFNSFQGGKPLTNKQILTAKLLLDWHKKVRPLTEEINNASKDLSESETAEVIQSVDAATPNNESAIADAWASEEQQPASEVAPAKVKLPTHLQVIVDKDRGHSIKEESSDDILNMYAGMPLPQEMQDALNQKITDAGEYLKRSQEMAPVTGKLFNDLNTLQSQNKADEIRAVQLLQKAKVSPEDLKAIYDYADAIQVHGDPHGETLTPEQEKIYNEYIRPLQIANNALFSKIRNEGIPISNEFHLTRFVAGKGGLFDRLMEGIKSAGQGSLLNKSAGFFKHRTMMAITDGHGVRQVVVIKNGEVTVVKGEQNKYLGPLKRNLPAPQTEYFDKKVMEKLEALAKSLGIKHTRKLKLGAWSKLGLSYTGAKYIETKASSPEAVLIHEIGHQIDEIYDLQGKFVDINAKGLTGLAKEEVADMKEQLRKLVDMTWEDQEPGPSFKKYVRKGEEKVAIMFEALVSAPDKFKEVAPLVYKKFTDFLASKPDLAPILDIKRSMVIGSQTVGERDIKGVFTSKYGDKFTIGDATTKEIEANTKLTYHKNALLNELVAYNKMRAIDRAMQFMENFKASEDFKKIAIEYGTADIPKGWRPVDMPQFRGYSFEPRIADTLDQFYKKMKSADDPVQILTAVNGFLRTTIFFNPLIHIPNITVHWLVNRGTLAFIKPQDYVLLLKTSARAIDSIIHQNKDYVDMLDSGANLLYFDVAGKKLTDLMLEKMGEELKKTPELAADVSKALGYANPANLIKLIYNFSSKATWFANDLATMQAIYEEEARGWSLKESIGKVADHIPDYRMPARVLDSKALGGIMDNPNITMFSKYHYGALKSYGVMARTLIAKNNTIKDKAEALDKMLMLGLVALVLYPMLDALAKKIWGDKNAVVRRAGATTLPYNIYRLLKNKIEFSDFVFSVLTPSPLLKVGVEELINRDVRTGKEIRKVGTEGADALKHAIASVSPLAYYQRMQSGDLTPAKFGASLVGVGFSRKNTMTDAELYADEIRSQTKYPPMSEDKLKQYKLSKQLEEQYIVDKNRKPLHDAVISHQITQKQMDSVISNSHLSTMEQKTAHMDYDQVKNIIEKGNPSPDELKTLKKVYFRKIDNKLLNATKFDYQQLKDIKKEFVSKYGH